MKGISLPEQNVGNVVLSKEFFEREPVFVTAAKFTDQYYIGIQPYGDDSFEVSIHPKGDGADSTNAINMFCNELIEQQVRHDLQNRFGKLRDLIVAQAFSPLEKQ